jgi:hypothetical protein
MVAAVAVADHTPAAAVAVGVVAHRLVVMLLQQVEAVEAVSLVAQVVRVAN